MELLVLDENTYLPNSVVEGYSSLVWTERFKDVGDFELVFPMSRELPTRLKIGTWLSLDRSDRAMRVRRIEIERNDDGVEIFKVRGEDASFIFKYRTAWNNRSALGTNPKWTREGTVRQLIERQTVRSIIGSYGGLDPLNSGDVISNCFFESFAGGTGHIPFPTQTVRHNIDAPTDTLTYIKELCDAYNIGFKIFLKKYDGNFYHQVFTGFNRTLDQSLLPPVIFSPQLENIKNISLLESDEEYATQIRIYSEGGFYGGSLPGEDSRKGFDKLMDTVVLQEPEGLTNSTLRDDWYLQKRDEHFAVAKLHLVMDGEITKSNQYVYGEDYHLGDLVDIVSDWGYSNRSRVVEQIFTSDDTGEKEYPTLATELIVTNDSWLGTDPSEIWGSPSPDNTWSER